MGGSGTEASSRLTLPVWPIGLPPSVSSEAEGFPTANGFVCVGLVCVLVELLAVAMLGKLAPCTSG